MWGTCCGVSSGRRSSPSQSSSTHRLALRSLAARSRRRWGCLRTPEFRSDLYCRLVGRVAIRVVAARSLRDGELTMMNPDRHRHSGQLRVLRLQSRSAFRASRSTMPRHAHDVQPPGPLARNAEAGSPRAARSRRCSSSPRPPRGGCGTGRRRKSRSICPVGDVLAVRPGTHPGRRRRDRGLRATSMIDDPPESRSRV